VYLPRPVWGDDLFFASNFYKLIIGTWYTLRGGLAHNPWHPSQAAKDPRPDVKVAIVYPICDEDVLRVAAGIAATWACRRKAFVSLLRMMEGNERIGILQTNPKPIL
jgi:membrane glycosyltransferase